MACCAALAVGGIGFGVYGLFFKKSSEAPAQNADATSIESELSNLKQKYSVLQNYVKELETSGTEVSEEVKSATSAETAAPLYGIIKDTETNHYNLSVSVKTAAWDGTTNVPYEITASSSNGELSSCKVNKITGDSPYEREEAKNCDTGAHRGKIVDVVGGVMGNGIGDGYGIYILTDQGELEFINGASSAGLDGLGTISKVNLPKKVIRVWGDSKLTSQPLSENGELAPMMGGAEVMVQYVDGTIETIFKYMKKG